MGSLRSFNEFTAELCGFMHGLTPEKIERLIHPSEDGFIDSPFIGHTPGGALVQPTIYVPEAARKLADWWEEHRAVDALLRKMEDAGNSSDRH